MRGGPGVHASNASRFCDSLPDPGFGAASSYWQPETSPHPYAPTDQSDNDPDGNPADGEPQQGKQMQRSRSRCPHHLTSAEPPPVATVG